jgi:tungstate transport system ATP-binding protein
MLDRVEKTVNISSFRHALGCRNLFYLAAGKKLINSVSLNFAASGITAILGFNGAGKSLLLRLLHGMIEPTAGAVLWNDSPIGIAERKRQAMVFQKPVLLRRTVLDNVRFVLANSGENHKDNATVVLERVGLAEFAGMAARRLSGGEQQRLALGLALARNPEILFLDEATASLDPVSIQAIEEIVSNAEKEGTKIIMVTHDVGQAKRLASEVVFLDQGCVTSKMDANAFFTDPLSDAARAYLSGRLPESHPV